MSSIKQRLPKDGGFTIIEVVLVLAIAGLIFLIVFLALPQLQRSRRDTQRRSDAGRVLSSLEAFSSNNQGQYPVTTAQQTDFVNNYFGAGDAPADPQTGAAYAVVWGAMPASPAAATMYINDSDRCVVPAGTTPNARDLAVRVDLEEGTYCQDNL